MLDVLSLEGRCALVTGATRGIGQAIAHRLKAQGAFVIGTATQPQGAERIQASLGEQGLGACLDVTDPDSIDRLFQQLAQANHTPTILVNNAGITRDRLLMRMNMADWDTVLATNLSAAYRLSQAVLKGMVQARWGRIINISSAVAALGNPGQINYAASKAGLEGFTRALAREVGGRCITVNAVAPGYIETDMLEQLSAEHRAEALKNIPLKRLGAPDEVAYVVAFLASPAASYMTGTTVPVNGGIYMG